MKFLPKFPKGLLDSVMSGAHHGEPGGHKRTHKKQSAACRASNTSASKSATDSYATTDAVTTEEEQYLFHMDTCPVRKNTDQTTSTEDDDDAVNDSRTQGKRNQRSRPCHVRRNTDDTDMTPKINNLTSCAKPVKPVIRYYAIDVSQPCPLLLHSPMKRGATPKIRNGRTGPVDVDALWDSLSSTASESDSDAEVIAELRNRFVAQLNDQKRRENPKPVALTKDVVSRHESIQQQAEMNGRKKPTKCGVPKSTVLLDRWRNQRLSTEHRQVYRKVQCRDDCRWDEFAQACR